MFLKFDWYVVNNRYSLFVCFTEIHLATILCTSSLSFLMILIYYFSIYYCPLGLQRRFPIKCLLMSSKNLLNNLKFILHTDTLLKLFTLIFVICCNCVRVNLTLCLILVDFLRILLFVLIRISHFHSCYLVILELVSSNGFFPNFYLFYSVKLETWNHYSYSWELTSSKNADYTKQAEH